MDNQKIVVLVYKTGGDYTAEYVEKLLDGLCSHNEGFGYVVLTDDKEYLNEPQAIPLLYSLPGWWSKLEMFELPPNHTYFYFDLDTIIKGSIQQLLDQDHTFTMLKDFNNKIERPASGVMAWKGNYSYLLHELLLDRETMDRYDPKKGGKLGDQAYISDRLGFQPEYVQDMCPNLVSSYKWDTEKTKEQTPVVCYHGKPRPHQTNWAWK